jgi:type IV pilus assembly protein PilM
MKKKKIKSAFGLDISDLSLKIVQLRLNGDRIVIQAFGKYNLKKGIIEKGEVKDRAKLVEAIKDALKKPIYGNFNAASVVTSLPDSESFIKLLEIDKSPNPLPDMIEQEMEKAFPIALNEIYYDYQPISKNEESQQVLVAAALRKVVDSYIATIKDCGLAINALETESAALARCLLTEESPRYKGKENNAYAIVDIGATASSMVIYSQGSIVSSLSLPINGEEMTTKIAQTLEINESQAEKAKIICGLDPEKAQGIIRDLLSDTISATIERIRSIIDHYDNSYPDLPRIKKIIISGGGSNVRELDLMLSQNIGIETVQGDIFANLDDKIGNYGESFLKSHNITLSLGKGNKSKKQDSTLSSKHDSSLDYATAIGLALRPLSI